MIGGVILLIVANGLIGRFAYKLARDNDLRDSQQNHSALWADDPAFCVRVACDLGSIAAVLWPVAIPIELFNRWKATR